VSDIATYESRDEAQAVADAMVGWPDPHPVELEEIGWVVTVDPDDAEYARDLRTDGYVR
jgi:hypothetical protein